MKLEEFVTAINMDLQNRFIINTDTTLVQEIISLNDKAIPNIFVTRCQKMTVQQQNSTTWKTLLFAQVSSKEELKVSLRWAALAKELLLDPETADIYLMICPAHSGSSIFSLEDCLRIESNEDFCRKFVLRPAETAAEFVERTFISTLNLEDTVDLGQDPLYAAFNKMESTYDWFSAEEKIKWTKAFTSGESGTELFNMITLR